MLKDGGWNRLLILVEIDTELEIPKHKVATSLGSKAREVMAHQP